MDDQKDAATSVCSSTNLFLSLLRYLRGLEEPLPRLETIKLT